MKEYLNADCGICSTRYHICPDCSGAKAFTPWRKIVCSPNCYKIYIALSSYTNGHAAKDETKEILKELDLSQSETFKDNIKAAIKEIMAEDTDIVKKDINNSSVTNIE